MSFVVSIYLPVILDTPSFFFSSFTGLSPAQRGCIGLEAMRVPGFAGSLYLLFSFAQNQ
jgi:hypothetical protein